MKRAKNPDSSSRLFAAMLLIPLGAYLLLVFALTLPLNKVLTNAVLSDSLLPNLLLILIELLEIFTYAFAFALILYAAHRPYTPSVSIRLALIYVGIIVLRYALTVMSAMILYGSRLFWQWYFEPTLLNNIPYCLLDILFVVAALLSSLVGSDRYYRKRLTVAVRGSLLLKDEKKSGDSDHSPALFRKIWDPHNPLQFVTLLLGCFLAVAKILSDVYFDVEYFASATSVGFLDVLSLVGTYASDLLAGLIFYVVSILILFRLHHAPKKQSPPPQKAE